MKLKYYMRGLGIGLCLAAIILSFGTQKLEKMTDEEIMQRAQKLGMTMPDKMDDQLHNVLNGLNATGSPSPTKSVAPTTSPTLTPTLAPTLAPTMAPTATPKPTSPPDVKVSFSIKPGMSSDSVAKILQEIGVVKSAEDFNKYMIEHGKASVIRVGDYSLSKKSSYEDIVKKITR